MGKLLSMLCGGGADSAYELMGESVWGENSLYLNLGFWTDSTLTYDDAAENLADHLGRVAELESCNEILDVGFGFGDQDIYWAQLYRNLNIKGINITPMHVEKARARVEVEGLSERVDLLQGSATDLPFEENCFDRVISLEAAFHFDSRKDFFQEAYRVLKPGSYMTIADLLPREVPFRSGSRTPKSFIKLIRMRGMLVLQSVPKSNIYTEEIFAKHLEDVGFVDVRIESIRSNVFDPFFKFFKGKKTSAAFWERQSTVMKIFYKALMNPTQRLFDSFDYIIVSARKPGVI